MLFIYLSLPLSSSLFFSLYCCFLFFMIIIIIIIGFWENKNKSTATKKIKELASVSCLRGRSYECHLLSLHKQTPLSLSPQTFVDIILLFEDDKKPTNPFNLYTKFSPNNMFNLGCKVKIREHFDTYKSVCC